VSRRVATEPVNASPARVSPQKPHRGGTDPAVNDFDATKAQSRRNALAHRPARSPYWKVIMSVRLSVVALGFNGSFAKFALPEFKTL